MDDPRVGTLLHDRYRVIERLTAGSMGVVYRGERVKLNRPVAIKVLHESYATTEDGMRRFEIEARAMSRLNHPNCVAVTDFGVEEGAPYLVMDFVTGRTLRRLIEAEGRLAAGRALEIMRQVLAGLAHAHRNGIIHRDIKPENIVVASVEGQGEQVRILDFGLAKLREDKSVTTGVAVGTPGYMSPEQTAGETVSERADIYGAGIILYELLVGRKPFVASDPFAVMKMHRETPPPPLAEMVPDAAFSSKLEAVVRKALAKRPEDRYASMGDFAAALQATPEAGGHSGAAPRSPRVLWGALGGVAVVLIAGVWLAGRGADQPATKSTAGSADAAATRSSLKPTEARRHPKRRRRPDPPPPIDAAPVAEIDAAAPPPELDAVAEAAEARLARGESRKSVIDELEKVRAAHPDRADVLYALGDLEAGGGKWAEAIEAYSRAVELAPAYAADSRLIDHAVKALADERAQMRAAKLIAGTIKERALPRLEEAATSNNPELAARAEELRALLAAPPQ